LKFKNIPYLKNSNGLIQPDRIKTAGKGSLYPAGDNNTDEGKAQNRRVVIKQIKPHDKD